MTEAAALAMIRGIAEVEKTSGGAATYGRLATGDFAWCLRVASHREVAG